MAGISRRSFVKYAGLAGAAVAISPYARAINAAYRLLPKPAEEIARVGGDFIPSVRAEETNVLIKPALVIPDFDYEGFKPADGLTRTKEGDKFVAEGGVIEHEFAGAEMIDLLKNPKYASAGVAKFGAVYNVDFEKPETSYLYCVYDWLSEKKLIDGDVLNLLLQLKNVDDTRSSMNTLGVVAGVGSLNGKSGIKYKKLAYAGLTTTDGFPKNWAYAPTTVKCSIGTGTSPSSSENHVVMKVGVPLTLANAEKVDVQGIMPAVGNYVKNKWLTVPANEVDGNPSTYARTSLPKDFPYYGEKIDISPALIIPDCSRAEYVPVDELELTELGKYLVEEEGWKLENEWSDTREVKLLDNGYNKTPNTDEAYLRLKADTERLYGIVAIPSKKKETAHHNMLFFIDTDCENTYKPEKDDIILNMYYDGMLNKKTAFAHGTGKGWPRQSPAPPEIISSTGLTFTPYSQSNEDKHLIYKFSIPLSTVNPNNLLRERMAVSIGLTDSDSWLTYPQNEEWITPYTWADAFYLSQTQAIPEFGSIHVPGMGRIDMKSILFPATVGILTAILLGIKKTSPHSHRQIMHYISELYAHQ